jgi:hypothetical protein
MHNGLAVVFFGSFVWHLLRSTNWNWLILGGLLLAAISTGITGRTTHAAVMKTSWMWVKRGENTGLGIHCNILLQCADRKIVALR